MKVLFAGGGTAGHINPALAIAGYVLEREPKAEILYVGSSGGMEERLVPAAGFAFKGIEISGFQRKLTPQNLKKNINTVRKIITASAESRRIISQFKPDICVGTGGYVSGPVLRTAAKMGIPTVIHEQNAYPGITTKMLSKRAKRVMLAIPDAEQFLKKKSNIVVTGNPIRKDVLRAKRATSRTKLQLDARPLILSFGGSLGARRINEAVADLLEKSAKDERFQHIHGYGQHSKWFPKMLEDRGVRLEEHPNLDVREYISDMPTCLAAADLVICRAGAITLSELQAQGKPSVLIPSPNVAENHQYHNAMALVKRKAAVIIEEKDLTGDLLCQTVEDILRNPDKLKKYGRNAHKMAIIDANERIYNLIKQVIREN